MPTQNKATLKNYFNAGDTPTEQEFANFIDSTVLKVNGMLPDVNGEVTVTDITGTAGGVTGNIPIGQVTGLQAEINDKVTASTLKTVNGVSLLNGPGNIVVDSAPTKIIAIPKDDYVFGSSGSSSNAFPGTCDRFVLQSDRTYMFRGKYIIHTSGGASQTIRMTWAVGLPMVVTSMEFTVTTFSSAQNSLATNVSKIQISGIVWKTLNTETTLPTTTIEFEGVFRCTTGGGNFTPKLGFSTFPSETAPNVNTIKAGSYVEIVDIGHNLIDKAGPAGMIG